MRSISVSTFSKEAVVVQITIMHIQILSVLPSLLIPTQFSSLSLDFKMESLSSDYLKWVDIITKGKNGVCVCVLVHSYVICKMENDTVYSVAGKMRKCNNALSLTCF